MQTADLGPLLLGLARGYFREAGFTFGLEDLKVAASGRESADRLKSGEADIAYSTYVPLIEDGIRDGQGVRFVSGASLAGPGSCLVLAMANSGIKSVGDLANARIAVTEEHTISGSLVRFALIKHGIDPGGVTWIEMEFSKMAYALQAGTVDAAFFTEPYLSHVQTDLEETTVLDAAADELVDIPTAAFGTTAAFADENPNTLKAFQRVMHRATKEANADWNSVVPLIQEFTKVPRDVAASASLLTMRSNVEVDQVQRVADLMRITGVLRNEFDVRRLFLPPPLSPDTRCGIPEGRPATATSAAGGCRLVRQRPGAPAPGAE